MIPTRVVIHAKHEWHVERVAYWTWTWAKRAGVIGSPPIWRETFWRIGPLHIKRFERVHV